MVRGLGSLYPCVPNKSVDTTPVVTPAQALQSGDLVGAIKRLSPWQWALILGAGYLLLEEPVKKYVRRRRSRA